MIAVLCWILLGSIIGWIAALLTGAKQRQTVVATTTVGIVGALMGGLLTTAVSGTNGLSSLSILTAICGATFLLAVKNAIINNQDNQKSI
jgi:uncharacterized membrane protein YeaQ/YmgE (transglycosylase-associated protein family)